jgi:hypothetical protein
VVALGLLYAIAVAVSAARLQQAYAVLEKDGRPMYAADILPLRVPDVGNGALLYESAALLLKAQPSPEASQPDARWRDLLGYVSIRAGDFAAGTLDPNKQAEFRQLMEQEAVTSAVSILRQGAQCPACRFDCDYDHGSSMNPHLSDLRMLGRILAAKTCLDAEAGRSDAAWDLVLAQVKMADGLRSEPAIVSQLVRMALVGLSCRTMQKLSNTMLPVDQQYDRLMSLLDTLDDTRPLVLAADGERLLMGEWLFTLPKAELYKQLRQVLSESYWPEIAHRLRFHLITFKPFFLGDHAAYLQLMREHTQLLQQPFSIVERNNLEKEWLAVPGRYRLTRTLTPAMTRIKDIHCRMIADVRITRTGLALLRYRQVHGGFPETLDALRLRDISDPFTGKPLLYRLDGRGFLVYSVGEDLKDNGGSPRQPKASTDYDILWRFPGTETP